MDNRISFDYNYLMSDFVKDGITTEELAGYEKKVAEICDVLDAKRKDGINTLTAWMDLPYSQDAIIEDIFV